MANQRMHRGLVALSASAVAAIYLAGYVRTQPADATLEAVEPTAVIATVSPSNTPLPTLPQVLNPAPARTAPTATPVKSSPTATTSTATTSSTLKDGMFSGQGTSRRGNVWVDVTISSGHIASVTITRSTLQYPVRDIAGLPSQVVARQSAQVDIVSGATFSSQAFRTAVSQALGQAKA
jgi:uncharacterized protein with FMN-binding domain